MASETAAKVNEILAGYPRARTLTDPERARVREAVSAYLSKPGRGENPNDVYFATYEATDHEIDVRLHGNRRDHETWSREDVGGW